MKTFVVAGGCFWCIDAVFQRLKGVESSLCGYAGGTADEAEYYSVSTGRTGHAEAVQVSFDESVIPADTLLDIFFLIHNPTTPNRQGADEGPQYRSALFYADEAQKQEFEEAIKRAQERWDDAIVTEMTQLDTFYAGEDAHQDYFTKNPDAGYCSIVIEPKVSKARSAYTAWFKDD